MSIDPREQALQSAYQMVSEHFPNVVMVAEAQFMNEEGKPQFAQLLRWYGCSTTATGLMVYAADLLCHTFGDRPQKPPGASTVTPITPQQEEVLRRALEILESQFICAIVVAQGEPILEGKGERSVKVIRCNGAPTMVAGLSQFASNALRRMAVE